MHSRLIATTRLAARYASTGLESRVQATKVLNLARLNHKLSTQPRLFSSARTLFEESKTSAAINEAALSGEPSSDDAPSTAAATPSSVESTSFPVTEPSSSTTTTADAAQEPAAAATPTPATAPELDPEEVTKRTVFVGGLSWNVDNQWLEDEVLKTLDLEEGVNSVRIARNPLGKSKGFAFVELASTDLASQLSGQRLEIDGREVEFVQSTTPTKRPSRNPDGASATGARFSNGPRNPPGATLWVGNVAWSATEETLEDAFNRFGSISRINQPMDRETGRSRGIAYVEFSSIEEAKRAYDVTMEEGLEIDGRNVRVDFAPEKDNRSGGTRRRDDGGFKPRGQNRRGGRGDYGGGGGRGDYGGGQRERY